VLVLFVLVEVVAFDVVEVALVDAFVLVVVVMLEDVVDELE
jgi:hypothetical protein